MNATDNPTPERALLERLAKQPLPLDPIMSNLIKEARELVASSKQATWEEKLATIKGIDPSASVAMRKPGDWYVDTGFEHAHGKSMLIGNYGNGASPEEAVEDHWQKYGDGRPFKLNDRWFRWNGREFEPSTRPEA